jgi:hypothetical protein
MYNERNGMTNAPNLFRNVPAKRIQTGRGKSRRLPRRLCCFCGGDGFIKQKTLPTFRWAGFGKIWFFD